MLATSGNEIKIWDFENFNLVNEYEFQKPISSFYVRPDNSAIACVFSNEAINVINLQTHENVFYNDIDAKCCCYDSFGRYLAVGLDNGNIDICEFKSNNIRKKTHKAHTSSTNCMSWSKNDRFIASGSANGTISLLNTITNQLSKPMAVANKTAGVTAIRYSSYSNTNLASAYDDGTIIYWDTTKEKAMCIFNKHEAPATCCILSPINDMLMLSGGLDNTFACYDIRSKKHIKSTSISGGITTLDMHVDGSTLAMGTANGNVQLYDLRSKFDEPVYTYQAHNTPLHCLKFLYEIKASKSQQKLDEGTSMKKSNSSSEHLLQQADRVLINKSNTFNNSIQPNDTTSKDSPSPSSQFTYNIYSPECISNKQSSTAQSSFVLHKNNTSANSIDSITPIVNHTAPSVTTNGTKTNLLVNNNKNLNNLKADLYSPVVSTSNNSSTNKTPATEGNSVSDYKLTLRVPNNQFPNTESSGKTSSSSMNVTPLRPNTLQTTTSSAAAAAIREEIAAASNKRTFNNNNTSLLNNSALNTNTSDSTIAGINAHAAIFPLEQMREIIKDTAEEIRDEFMSENFKFKAELIREFMNIKQEIRDSFKACSINDALVTEIERLREENKRLKKLF